MDLKNPSLKLLKDNPTLSVGIRSLSYGQKKSPMIKLKWLPTATRNQRRIHG